VLVPLKKDCSVVYLFWKQHYFSKNVSDLMVKIVKLCHVLLDSISLVLECITSQLVTKCIKISK